jgi:hypothetical protein
MPMTVNYDAWDSLNEIPLWAAACLWRNTEPTYELRDNPLPGMQEMMKEIELGTMKHIRPKTFGQPDGTVESNDVDIALWVVGNTIIMEECNRYPEFIPRYALEKMADDKGVKPKFLFPEMRTEQQLDSIKNMQDDPRRLNSYRIVVLSLLTELKIDPAASASTKRVKALIESAGYSVSDRTIREILKSLKDIPEERKRE